jgi:hypothetical protein
MKTINDYWFKPWQIDRNAMAILTFCLTVLFMGEALAQNTTMPICTKGKNNTYTPHCTSKDLAVTGAFLTAEECNCEIVLDSDGNNISTVDATLNMTLFNKTGSVRTSFAFFAILERTFDGETTKEYITRCKTGVPAGIESTISFDDPLTVKCGETLKLTNVYLAWTDASDNAARQCPLSFCDISPKCGKPQDIIIRPLLTASATPDLACEGQSDGSITVNPVGGIAPYKYSLDGITYFTPNLGENFYTFKDLAADSYTIYVKDSATPTNCVHYFDFVLEDEPCCVPPTITTEPDNDADCIGGSASFTFSYTDGDPAADIKWQVSTDGGITWDYVSGSPYSGEQTNTLTITPLTSEMNGYMYSAELISGICEEVYTTPVTLTVYDTPDAPTVIYEGPQDCTETTYSLKIENAANGTYTLCHNNTTRTYSVPEDLSENATDVVFSGLTQGVGYSIIFQDANGCTALAETCGSATCDSGRIRPIDTSSNLIEQKKQARIDDGVMAYPVPFSHKATVEFRMSNTEKYEVNLYDMKGSLIKQLKSGKAKAGELQQIEVDGHKLPEGMYLVRLITSNGAKTVKLLKKD